MSGLLKRVYTAGSIISTLLVTAWWVAWGSYMRWPAGKTIAVSLICLTILPWASHLTDIGIATVKRRRKST